MSLFRRRKADGPADGVADADGADGTAEETPGPEGPGPHDVADVPELGGRLDLGALRIPPREGMNLRLEMEKASRNLVAVTVGLGGSAMQLQAFAAPRSAGIWAELREEIAPSVTKQGGTVEEAGGPFGPELVARLPVRTEDGRAGHRPARFLGVDGPRWFLRAVLTGPAAVERDAAAPLEELLADVVVVRGSEPRAPRDVLLLHAPGQRPAPPPAVDGAGPEPLDPLRRGPEITETR